MCDYISCFNSVQELDDEPLNYLLQCLPKEISELCSEPMECFHGLSPNRFKGYRVTLEAKGKPSPTVTGKNFRSPYINGVENFSDEHGHGTFICGAILQLVPKSDLYVARVTDEDGSIFADSVRNAFAWLSKNRVDIIYCSFPNEKTTCTFCALGCCRCRCSKRKGLPSCW